MSDADLRQAARVRCDVPLRLLIDGTWHAVRVVDMSRTGVRLRVPLAALGFEEGAGLAALAAHLEHVVPRRAAAEFHPERLGGLVTRHLHVVRIGLPDGETGEVELGCRLDERLGDVEAAALEVPVPREGESAPDADAPPREAYHPREHEGLHPSLLRELHVVVRPTGDGAAQPWSGAPERMDPTGLTTRFRDRTRLGLADEDDEDARPLTVAFSDAYGPIADLEILRDEVPIYRGPGRLTRVEVEPRRPGDLVVGFAFGRPLAAEEQKALNLA